MQTEISTAKPVGWIAFCQAAVSGDKGSATNSANASNTTQKGMTRDATTGR